MEVTLNNNTTTEDINEKTEKPKQVRRKGAGYKQAASVKEKNYDLDRRILRNKGYNHSQVDKIVEVMKSPFKENKLGNNEKVSNQDEIRDLLDVWHKDFLFFVESAILTPYNKATGENFKVTKQQKEACYALCKIVNDKIEGNGKGIIGLSIMAGKGTGKDAWVSWAILWFMTFPYPKIPCLSVSADQLNKVLWSEISKWLGNSLIKEWFTLRTEKLYFNGLVDGEKGLQWLAFPKAVPKTGGGGQIKALAGVHSKYLMEVVDEGSGIRDEVYEELETNLTGKVNLMLTVFNPSKRDGYAVRTQDEANKNKWVSLNWNAEECELVNQSKVSDMQEKFGRDSNIYRVNILGLPPIQSGDTWFTYEEVMNAVEREIMVNDSDDPGVLSLDCGAGGDKAVLCYRKGYKVEWFRDTVTKSALEMCEWAGHHLDITGAEVLYVDAIGIGWGVVSILQDMKGSRVVSVDVRNMASDTIKYYNKRAELYDRLHKAFSDNLISIPNDEELIEELLALKLMPESTRMRLILKKEIRSEIGRSTNKSDALAFTCNRILSSKYRNSKMDINNLGLYGFGTELNSMNRTNLWMLS